MQTNDVETQQHRLKINIHSRTLKKKKLYPPNTMSAIQQKDPVQHIKERPEMYLGCALQVEDDDFLTFDGNWRPEVRRGKVSHAIFKIFDEVLVNAQDQSSRDKSVKNLDITYENGVVSIQNDGKGIPIERTTTYDGKPVYSVELAFAHLRSGQNFNDSGGERFTGGLNGVGVKLTNIFSKRFTVKTTHRSQQYTQTWSNRMSSREEPVIGKKESNFSGTKITFQPVFDEFGIRPSAQSIQAFFTRRALEISATSRLSVHINGKKVPIKNLKEFAQLFTTDEVVHTSSERWSVVVSPLIPMVGQHYSFVNGVPTPDGGKHITELNEIGTALAKAYNRGKKKEEHKKAVKKVKN